MKQLWTRFEEYFEARSRRERLLITLTVLAAIVVFSYVAVIEPLSSRQKIAERQIAQQKTELTNIQQRMVVTQAGARDEDQAIRANLDKTQQQIADINKRLNAITRTLVAPNRMPGFLQEILKSNRGIQLVSLRNLPVGDLIERKPVATSTERTDPAVAAASNTLKGQNITVDGVRGLSLDKFEGPLFKHGVEITVVGAYGDLLAYLSQLEKMQQQVLWNSIKLTVEEHPRARMTLTVYTLSMDRTWLTV